MSISIRGYAARIRDAAFGALLGAQALHADALPAGGLALSGAGAGGWGNPMTGQGGRDDPARGATFGYQIPLPEPLRDNLYHFEAMTGIVVDRPAKDLIRRGIDLKGFEGFDIQALTSKLDDLRMLPQIGRAYKWCRKDGGSALVMIIDDGRPAWMPVDRANLRRVHALQVLERRQISIAAWNHDPTSEGYSEPLMYYIHATGPRSAMNLIHRDRVHRFVNGDLPHRSMQQFSGWGISVIDRIWNPLRAKGAALAALSTILSSYAVDVVKIKGYADAIKMGKRKDLQDRADLMRATLGNLSKIFIDADGEDFSPLVRSASGLAEIVEMLIDEVQASSSIPKSILRGISPGGLGDGENAGEVRGYYDFISGEQQEHLIPAATRIIDLVASSQIGPLQGRAPSHWWVEPRPLWQPTDVEIATIRGLNASARAQDLASTVITIEQALTDPTLQAFYDLDGDDDLEDDLGETRPFPEGHTPMNTREAANHFGVNPGTIRTMISSGKLNAYQLNGRYVLSLQELMAAARKVTAAPGPAANAEEPRAAA